MKILFIDEDKAALRYYMLALKDNGFDYEHIRNADDAIKAIQTPDCSYDFIILDSAMPAGAIYINQNTEDGTLTGKFLFNDIRKKCPNVPILILTNFWLEWVQAALAEKRVRGEKKINVTPNKLIEIIQQMLRESKS
jgi:DNA-binding response OmpR family regulator